MILAAAEAEYFSSRGWTVFLLFCPSGGFVHPLALFPYSNAANKMSHIRCHCPRASKARSNLSEIYFHP
jgi:hypothetical protein